MPGRIVPNDRPPVVLTAEEWSEISSCASALWSALKCFDERSDEAWELVVAVQQRLQRALSPIDERVTDEFHKETED